MPRKPVALLIPILMVTAMLGVPQANAAPVHPDEPRDGKAQSSAAHDGHDHDHDRPEEVDPTTVPRQAAAQAVCSGGMAGDYPCSNVDLLSNVPLASMGGGGSAGWGWTDPATGKEYAIVGRSNGTSFVDISNPTAPVYLGNLPSATGTSSWRELSVHNNHVYVVSDSNGAHGLQIFNLTRLRSITSPPVAFTADARDTSFNNGHTVHINNATGIAYVNGTNTCSGGPRMFDLANPTSPAFVGCVSGDGYTHDSQAVIYRGPHTAYQGREILAASNEDTLTIWDVTNKAAPVQLARRAYAGRGYTHQGWFTEDHRYFMLDDETDETSFGHRTKTYVFDMATLTNPVLIGTYLGPTNASDHNQFVKGNYVYQANYRAGLRILDLTNVATSASLAEAGYFDVDPTSNAAGYAGAWHVYPYFPSGNVAIFSIQRGLFVVRPNLGGPPPTTVYADAFETATGWSTNPAGTDTATSGAWERGDPEQSTSGTTVTQLGTTVSGTNCLVTARLAGASAGANDVDGGTTTIRSPGITLPASGTLTLNFSWYLAHLNNASSADFIRVSVVHAGGTTTVFEQLGAASNRSAAWAAASANLSAYAGQTIRIQITAADAATGSLVEAAIDDLRITTP